MPAGCAALFYKRAGMGMLTLCYLQTGRTGDESRRRAGSESGQRNEKQKYAATWVIGGQSGEETHRRLLKGTSCTQSCEAAAARVGRSWEGKDRLCPAPSLSLSLSNSSVCECVWVLQRCVCVCVHVSVTTKELEIY